MRAFYPLISKSLSGPLPAGSTTVPMRISKIFPKPRLSAPVED